MADRSERPLMDALVKRAFDANLRYWEAVGRATTDYVQAVTKIWADAPITWTPGAGALSWVPRVPADAHPAATPALLLEGVMGSQARAVVLISNDLDREAEAMVSVSELRAPDGRWVSFDIRSSPERVKLAAGARLPVTLTADITDAMAEGVDYHGEINVPGLSNKGVPVVLRRRGA